jgi:hypothetical protein
VVSRGGSVAGAPFGEGGDRVTSTLCSEGFGERGSFVRGEVGPRIVAALAGSSSTSAPVFEGDVAD